MTTAVNTTDPPMQPVPHPPSSSPLSPPSSVTSPPPGGVVVVVGVNVVDVELSPIPSSSVTVASVFVVSGVVSVTCVATV